MTFRAGKRHKVQESNHSSKNVLRLASRLQRFLNTGKASRQDLKAIDNQFLSLLREQGDQILKMVDRLREVVPKGRTKDALDTTCRNWARWLADLDSKKKNGYRGFSNVKLSPYEAEAQSALLEAVVDADADLFRSILAFNSNLQVLFRKSSYETLNSNAIVNGAGEIYEAYLARQKILTKITS